MWAGHYRYYRLTFSCWRMDHQWCCDAIMERRKSSEKKFLLAIYERCYALELSFVHNAPAPAESSWNVTMLCKALSGSVLHNLSQSRRNLSRQCGVLDLKKLCVAWRACQCNEILAVKKTLPAIRATLADVQCQSKPRRRTEAGAVSAIADDRFVLQLNLSDDVFRTTRFVPDRL